MCKYIFLFVFSILLYQGFGQSGNLKRIETTGVNSFLVDPAPKILDLFLKTPGSLIDQDFEDLDDFTFEFSPWTVEDVDGGITYGIEGVEFPNTGSPMAFIVFNPENTTPSLGSDPAIQPHGGDRFAACFSAIAPETNDDWIISPLIDLGDNSILSFWVKSYTNQYGLEKFRVAVSTTDNNPASFTFISGATPLLAPADNWEEKIFELDDYDNQTVYIAIQCVSEDAFIFMLDDIVIETQFTGLNNPENLVAELDESTGIVQLQWNFEVPQTEDWVACRGNWELEGDVFTVTSDGMYEWSSLYYDQLFDDFEFDVNMKMISGTADNIMGILFNGLVWPTYENGFWNTGVSFLISNTEGEQSYTIGEQTTEGFVIWQDWTESEFINTGYNVVNALQVVHDGSNAEFFINDNSVGNWPVDIPYPGYVGITMWDESANGVAEFSWDPVLPGNSSKLSYYRNFRIYRNEELIGTTAFNKWIDELPQSGSYEYYVTADYSVGESLPSNTALAEWNLSVPERSNIAYNIFPNPAGEFVNVRCEHLISSIKILNFLGQKIYSTKVQSFEYTLELTGFIPGIYLLVLETEQGSAAQKIRIE
jgi:hypothetical protein